jgi:indole-3-glycerol phosphate synthase
MNILEEIIANKRIEIARLKADHPQFDREVLPEVPHFMEALRADPMGLIAEVKRRSPSAGEIRAPFNPAEIALAYQAHGASAISCLMDNAYFGGGEEDFIQVRAVVELPMLYKEFVIDPWQIEHARCIGASAVLLIVSALEQTELLELSAAVESWGMQSLVEVHDQVEMERALACGASCIGVNNRNLKTFKTSLEVTYSLAEMCPQETLLVSESGIRTAADIQALQEVGVEAVLVGESLLRQADVGVAIDQLMKG